MSVPVPFPAHDPERCATCSGKRRYDEYMTPIREAVAEFLERIDRIISEAREEGRG